MQLRVRALESILLEKGYVDPAAIDELIETYEKKIGPRNGARVVARAWSDPEYFDWLVRDATAALVERIRRGDADAGPFHAAVRAHVRETVEDKLRVANPRLVPRSAGG